MAFVLDGRWRALDPNTNSQMVIEGTPQIEFRNAIFSCPEMSARVSIVIQPKFGDKPLVANDTNNPQIMIHSSVLNSEFRRNKMITRTVNTRIAIQIVRMIAFINKSSPMSLSPFLWSDYYMRKSGKLLYNFPSDAELLILSFDPNKELSI